MIILGSGSELEMVDVRAVGKALKQTVSLISVVALYQLMFRSPHVRGLSFIEFLPMTLTRKLVLFWASIL